MHLFFISRSSVLTEALIPFSFVTLFFFVSFVFLDDVREAEFRYVSCNIQKTNSHTSKRQRGFVDFFFHSVTTHAKLTTLSPLLPCVCRLLPLILLLIFFAVGFLLFPLPFPPLKVLVRHTFMHRAALLLFPFSRERHLFFSETENRFRLACAGIVAA